MLFAWPATRELDAREELLLGLFLQNLAGDATTNLYKRFVDTRTRVMDLGAKGVSGFVSEDQGHPVYVIVNDVAPVHMTEERSRPCGKR